jgi:3-methylcrotonyl-CoA carboxylase alpha subunit
MFKKILIANRGEIACRIAQTCRKLGVQTVAVYSDADARALHVASADQAVRIGEAAVADSYLRGDVIINAALQTGAEAIHPGYGFLSENPEFVESVEAAGLRFIGPSAKSIRAMGLKDAAKALMTQAGVPVVPGYHGDNQDPDFLAQQAAQIGYPVLIKARAGGGGKGMRKVESSADFKQALEGATREAQASFADGACLIEKYIDTPRHIEIQVFGDDHGNVVHLFERDCSLQRRHQKVIEEAPAPGMTDEMRQAMGEAAVKACKAIDYSGAGTIEFIVDATDGLKPDGFWFMEMNTRLQVEHPVTEAITGQDLVEWQLRVAAGEALPLTQGQLSISGWSFEARVYAEDADRGFLPATGTLATLVFPQQARVDTGVRQGDTITPYYDPMIAKLTVHGNTRQEALQQLHRALLQTYTAGAITNVHFLAALCNNESFASGRVDTGLIERDLDSLLALSDSPPAMVAVAALGALGLSHSDDALQGFSLWRSMQRHVCLKSEQTDDVFDVSVSVTGHNEYQIEFEDHSLLAHMFADHVVVNDQVLSATVVKHQQQVQVFCDGCYSFIVPDPLVADRGAEVGGDAIAAPMPGQIKVVNVSAGDKVDEGDALLVLEAMKMEHTLTAPRRGVVAEVAVTVEQQVEAGAVLVSLESEK